MTSPLGCHCAHSTAPSGPSSMCLHCPVAASHIPTFPASTAQRKTMSLACSYDNIALPKRQHKVLRVLPVAFLKVAGHGVRTVQASRCQKSPCCIERQHSYLNRVPMHQAYESAVSNAIGMPQHKHTFRTHRICVAGQLSCGATCVIANLRQHAKEYVMTCRPSD